jgi:histidine triad (HIT) family protein
MAGTDAQTGSTMTAPVAKECRFCEIVRGSVSACIVFADDTSLAFLDRRPLFPGHLLLVPREHLVTLTDIPDHLIAPLFRTARLLAQAVEAAMAAEGSFVAMNNRVSQSIPHLHIHIVPRRRHDGLKGFFWPRQTYRDEADLARVGALLRTTISRLQTEGGA